MPADYPERIEAPARALEAAARAICDADPLSPSPDAPIVWRGKPAKAWEPRAAILKAAVEAGLFCHPPNAWVAPWEATEGMQAAYFADMGRTVFEDWAAMRDASLKEQAKA